MSRYFTYLMFLNMIVNVSLFVPQILIKDRFHGSVSALFISVPIGMLLMYIFLASLRKFPGQGLTYILNTILPRWISKIMVLLFASMFLMAGSITLLTIADTSIRYISPETKFTVGIVMFLIVICMTALHGTKQIFHLIEMIILLNAPLILFIIVKAFWNHSYSWDAVMAVGRSYDHLPTLSALSAATYIFSAYTNLVVFNTVLGRPVSPRWIWFFGPLGLGVLITSFAVPIAFQGADGVSDFIYPWIITADSMRVELGVVERVLPLFLLLYASISLGSIIVHWHVAYQLVKESLPSFLKPKPAVPWTIFGAFAAFVLTAAQWGNEKNIYEWGLYWIQIRFPCEILLAILLLIACLRRKRSS